jgi:hypothetical protein
MARPGLGAGGASCALLVCKLRRGWWLDGRSSATFGNRHTRRFLHRDAYGECLLQQPIANSAAFRKDQLSDGTKRAFGVSWLTKGEAILKNQKTQALHRKSLQREPNSSALRPNTTVDCPPLLRPMTRWQFAM